MEAERNRPKPNDEAASPLAGVRKSWLLFWVAVMLAIPALSMWRAQGSVVELPYGEFQELLAAGEIAEAVVAGERVTGRLATPREGRDRFATFRVEGDLAKQLEDAKVPYAGRPTATGLGLWLRALLPIALLLGFWFWMMRRAMGRGGPGAGLMGVGRSKAKLYVENDIKVTFEDVAGVDEAKEELSEVVAFLRAPESYGRLGARMPKGLLLVGPPGTGKTLLARAVAGEAGVPFFSISGSEFVEMFVGVGASRVRDLFERARAQAPCIIFVDELDALGRARGSGGMFSGNDEKEQTLNQLLTEMDGFDPSSGVILIAATNRPEVLDPALLRAGRFDRQVLVDRPDRKGRSQILEVHLRKVRAASSVSSARLAEFTTGFSGADLANLVNEAALVATRQDAAQVEMHHFTEAIERIVAGLEKKNRLLNPREREIVAHHELGHAIVATALGGDPVHKISIVPRGIGALGYTMQRPTDDRFLLTREELETRLSVLMGGRAAELAVYEHLSTGAADDLARATDLAHDMVTRFAMVPELGNAAYAADTPNFLPSPLGGRRAYSEDTAREIDCAVRKLVDDALVRATRVLETHRALLIDGARQLLERETLTEHELQILFASISVDRAA